MKSNGGREPREETAPDRLFVPHPIPTPELGSVHGHAVYIGNNKWLHRFFGAFLDIFMRTRPPAHTAPADTGQTADG